MSATAVLTPVIPAGPPLEVTLGQSPPMLSGDAGGWEEVNRPRKRAFTRWSGVGLRQLVLDVLLDGFASDAPVEAAIGRLRSWCDASGDQATVIGVAGAGVPPMAQGGRWGINDLAWGDSIRRDDGQTIRQAVAITLLEYIEPDILLRSSPAAAARDRAATGVAPSSPTTKAGVVVKKTPTRPGVSATKRDPARDPVYLARAGRAS